MHAAFNKVLLRDKIDRIPTRVLSKIPAAFLRGALFLQKIIYMAFSLSFFFSVDFRREPNFEASITLDECLKNWIKPKIFLFRLIKQPQKRTFGHWVRCSLKSFWEKSISDHGQNIVGSNLVRLSLRLPSTTGTPSSPSISSEMSPALPCSKLTKAFSWVELLHGWWMVLE